MQSIPPLSMADDGSQSVACPCHPSESSKVTGRAQANSARQGESGQNGQRQKQKAGAYLHKEVFNYSNVAIYNRLSGTRARQEKEG